MTDDPFQLGTPRPEPMTFWKTVLAVALGIILSGVLLLGFGIIVGVAWEARTAPERRRRIALEVEAIGAQIDATTRALQQQADLDRYLVTNAPARSPKGTP